MQTWRWARRMALCATILTAVAGAVTALWTPSPRVRGFLAWRGDGTPCTAADIVVVPATGTPQTPDDGGNIEFPEDWLGTTVSVRCKETGRELTRVWLARAHRDLLRISVPRG